MSAYTAPWITEELTLLQDACAKFYATEFAPHEERWQKQGHVDREAWLRAGQAGILCASIPEEYGGAGGTFHHEAIILGEQFRPTGYSGFGNTVHSQIGAHYILNYGSEEQKRRWLPKMATGELICAIAMTEPGAGSDLQNMKTTALKDGNHYVVNGSKTFITNGQLANLIMLAVKTDPSERAKGVSIDFVESFQGTGLAVDIPMAPPPVKQISVQELKERMDRGDDFVLVDVRNAQEREKASLEGTLVLDQAGMQAIDAMSRDTELLFLCHHGRSSLGTAEHYRKEGFTNLTNVEGGLDAWSREIDPSFPRY